MVAALLFFLTKIATKANTTSRCYTPESACQGKLPLSACEPNTQTNETNSIFRLGAMAPMQLYRYGMQAGNACGQFVYFCCGICRNAGAGARNRVFGHDRLCVPQHRSQKIPPETKLRRPQTMQAWHCDDDFGRSSENRAGTVWIWRLTKTNYMRTIVFIFMLLLLSCQQSHETSGKPIASTCEGRRCSGDASCSACKNCSGCKHCAKEGGTCGVCEPEAPKKKRRK